MDMDPTLADRLVEAILSGDWPLIVGGLLLVLAAAARYLLEDRLSERGMAWLSLARGVALGLGAPLCAGAPWRAALVTGLVGLFVSGGFLDKVKDVLPPKGGGAATAALLLLLLPAAGGCGAGAQPWLTARSAVSAASTALGAVEDLVPEDAEGREEAFAATRTALDLGEQAIGVWQREATSEAPTGWAKWVSDALGGLSRLIGLVKACGVPVPAGVEMAVAGVAALLPLLGGGS